jgi:patatin-like phospholipase/acyl hydrolase
MKAVSKRLSIEDPLPCEYFHLIVGSEWGGILAIMLGRLRRVSFASPYLLHLYSL